MDDDQISDRSCGGQRGPVANRNNESNTVTVRSTLKGRRLYLDRLERFALCMLKSHEVYDAELSILIAGDSKLRRLNRQYRDIDRPTDVLSFAQDSVHDPSGIPCVLGDVVVSADRAVRQARDAGHSLRDELMLLVAHGILHLLGYDHQTPADESEMRAAEQAALDTGTGLCARSAGDADDG